MERNQHELLQRQPQPKSASVEHNGYKDNTTPAIIATNISTVNFQGTASSSLKMRVIITGQNALMSEHRLQHSANMNEEKACRVSEPCITAGLQQWLCHWSLQHFGLVPCLGKIKSRVGWFLVPNIINPVLCSYTFREQRAKNTTKHQNPLFKVKK